MILLDTHVLIWLLDDSPRLGRSAREAVERHADDTLLSAMTFWELAMLTSKSQLALPMSMTQLIDWVVDAHGMAIVQVSALIAVDANSLPRLHGDPVDRLLIATARAMGCELMTADRIIHDYAAAGHLQAIDACH